MYLEQLLLVGVLGGAVLSLVGVGFTLVIGVGKVANFAHGAFVAVGMYLGYWIGHTLGLNPYVLFVPALLGFTIVGWGIAELFEWRGRKVGAVGELLVGLALLLLINGLLAVRFGTNPVTLNNFEMGSVSLAGTRIPGSEIYAAGFTLVVGVGIYLFLRGSRWGRALRAVAENPQSAALYGIRVPVAQRVAVTGSIALAGIAGLVISPFSVLTPDVGTNFLITAFAVIVIGGVGNTVGAVLAGLLIGVVDSLAIGYLSTVWTTLGPLLIILAFLLIRPVSVEL